MRPGVLFLNFGGPTDDASLEPFLRELLSDVLPGPAPLARLAAGRLAPLRARKVRENYRAIGWSPLVAESRAQADAVMALLDGRVPHAMGMMFTPPTVEDGLRALLDAGVDRVVAVGLFPHYSFATSAGAYDKVHRALRAIGRPDLPIHTTRAFFDDPPYLEAVAATVREAAARLPGAGPIDLLFSAHGLPLSFIHRGDPYPEHVRASARGVVRTLTWRDPWHLGWQSRLGPVRWLEPAIPEEIARLAGEGCQRLLMVPISFVGEHIETLDEIDREYAHLAAERGIPHFGRARALGLQPAFIRCLAGVVSEALDRFGRYTCARCLVPKPDAHRRRKRCVSCAFEFPEYLREG